MAKKSSIEKNARRIKLAKSVAVRRARLKAVAIDRTAPPEDRFAAQLKLAELPRNASATRVRNRCSLTGRPRQAIEIGIRLVVIGVGLFLTGYGYVNFLRGFGSFRMP